MKGQRTRQEDEQAFREIHAANALLVRKILYRYCTACEMDDLVQQVFIKVWFGLADFKGESSLKTWVVRIAINVGNDFLRSQRRRSWLSFVDPFDFAVSKVGTPATGDAVVLALATRKAIAGLSAKLREVLVLASIEDLSEKEISHALGISPGTVKSRLHAARARLKEIFDEDGVKDDKRLA